MIAEADPRTMLEAAPMRPRQFLCMALCAVLNALDGYDILSVSFASAGIAREWRIKPAALGVVLSFELVGMSAGSLLFGQVADRIGRVRTAVLCLLMMAAGMATATQAHSVGELAASRLLAGLGIGGMLPTANALTAEYTNRRWRNAGIGLMSAGYPAGVAIGGPFARAMLAQGDWRGVFLVGAVAALLVLPLAWWLLPEPVGALIARRPANALAKVNRSLATLGHGAVASLPAPAPQAMRPSPLALFAPAMRRRTIILIFAYFFNVVTFYFMLKWVPKLVVDMGFSPADAGGVLQFSAYGQLLGAALFSLLALRIGLRPLLLTGMLLGAAGVVAFGQVPHTLVALSWAAAAAGFTLNGAVAIFYPLIARAFPTAVRAGGTGMVIGLGRGGAAAGPILAGALLQAGLGLAHLAMVMAIGSVIGAGILWRAFPGEAEN